MFRYVLHIALTLAAVVPLVACNATLNGKPLFGGGGNSPADPQGASDRPSAPEPEPDRADVTATATEPVLLEAGFGPNPLAVRGEAGTATKSVLDLHGDNRSSCSGYVTEGPSMVLRVDAPSEELSLTAASADVLFVRHQGSYRCSAPQTHGNAPEVSLEGWSGEVEVWIGRTTNQVPVEPVVIVEDLARPRTLPWLDGVEPMQVARAPNEPKVLSRTVPSLGETPAGVIGCRGSRFREDPDLLLRLERPVTKLVISVRSPRPTQLLVMGPIPEDRRNIPALCYEHDVASYNRLEAGLYAVKIGSDGPAAPASLVLRHAEAKRQPLRVASDVAHDLSLEERRVVHHFPMLEEDDVWNSDRIRQQLFLHAPSSLFVFPKYDLDKDMAHFRPRVGTAPDTHPPKDAPVSYPRKDEPLLQFKKGHYVAADGNIFSIRDADLTLDPAGPPQIPSKVRNPGLSLGYSINSADADGTKREKKILARLGRARQVRHACSDRIWGPVNRKIRAIQKGSYSEAQQERIGALEHSARKQERSRCNKPFWPKEQAAWDQLMEARTQRRKALLARIRKHLGSVLAEASASR